jgi:phosphate transport system substrate-binding protein
MLDRLVRVLLLFGLSALLVACEGAAVATPPPVTLTIAGSTSMAPVLTALTDAYTRQYPMSSSTCAAAGARWVRRRSAPGATTSSPAHSFHPTRIPGARRPPATKRSSARRSASTGWRSSSTPAMMWMRCRSCNCATSSAGSVLNWQALGGDAGEVVLVSREDGSGARILFEERVMGEERVSLTAVVMPTSQDVVDYVAGNPAAIGYVSRAHTAAWIPGEAVTTTAALAETPVKVLELEGRWPTRETVAAQQYGLTQPLYLITRGAPAGRVRQFIDFVLSPAGQAIVARYHAPIR